MAQFLGDVPRDFDVAGQFTPFVSDGIDKCVHPKAAAVLPNPPALSLESALTGRSFERDQVHFQMFVFPRVKDREALADYLVRAIAFDALRSGIPRRDVPVCVEHVYSV